jgi:hypothetical protein
LGGIRTSPAARKRSFSIFRWFKVSLLTSRAGGSMPAATAAAATATALPGPGDSGGFDTGERNEGEELVDISRFGWLSASNACVGSVGDALAARVMRDT